MNELFPFTGYIINENGDKIIIKDGIGNDGYYYVQEYDDTVLRVAEDNEILGEYDAHSE